MIEGPWVVDELAFAGAEHLDAAYVAGYDRKSGYEKVDDATDPTGDLPDLRAHGLNPVATLVDLGAGTGRLALAAAPHAGRVVAVDVSPAMIDAIRARAAAAGLTNVDATRAGFLTYEHPGPPADVVYTRNALHQLPDFFKALALHRIAGMLRPGGTLLVRDLVYDFGPGEAPAVFADWFAGAASDPREGYTAEDYATHIRTEFSTYRWLFEPMLDAAGFDIVDASYHGRLYGRYVCRRRG
ncbi:class I SAM-dependent methyltransferase [Rhizomonospora bruguierae]|uniref:class I SAM-dependent methyltransferase n=1 Tax=Rhizomonospora bruguierae TaxID=1581705 RepID=UPI0020BFAD1E|nr:class I SAM-dependent methyltransferase [Micromonospora sp. NBRC 107566]